MTDLTRGLPFQMFWICLVLVGMSGVICRAEAEGHGPEFVVDPNWPKPLPKDWVIGQVSGVCVDAQDHVFIVNRNDMTDKEAEVAHQAPPYIEFDPEGNVVNSFGDWSVVPNITHGCKIDYENNFWTAGNGDGIIQKYSHDGRLLMEIGKRGVVDTSDGTLNGRALNGSGCSTTPAEKFCQASGVQRLTPKVTFLSPRQTGAGESKNSSR
jgi:hypothetical protein